MRMRGWAVAVVGLALFGVGPTWAQGQPKANRPAARGGKPAADEGVDVQGAGPVHEAFARPADDRPRTGPVVAKEPPRPVKERIPDQRPADENATWVPGYWSWDEERSDYTWVSGCWRLPPPEQQWVPGYWSKVENGWRWVSGYWTPVAAAEDREAVFLPEPPPPKEEDAAAEADAGPEPAADRTRVSGNWVYDGSQYLWRPGYTLVNRADWVWVPASYQWTPRGYTFVDGYWDYSLARRGLLFAPAVISPTVFGRPGWAYRPRYVVPFASLYESLFVSAARRSYFFGDYFDPRWRRAGLVPWYDYRIGRHGWDPLFHYERWAHRADARWERDLHARYEARFRGEAPRPPRNLAAQRDLVRRDASVARNHVATLAPLAAAGAAGVALHALSRDERQRLDRDVARVNNTRVARRQVELRHAGHLPDKVGWHLPPPGRVVHATGAFRPPARPVAAHDLAHRINAGAHAAARGKVGTELRKDLHKGQNLGQRAGRDLRQAQHAGKQAHNAGKQAAHAARQHPGAIKHHGAKAGHAAHGSAGKGHPGPRGNAGKRAGGAAHKAGGKAAHGAHKAGGHQAKPRPQAHHGGKKAAPKSTHKSGGHHGKH